MDLLLHRILDTEKTETLKYKDCGKWWHYINKLLGKSNKSQPLTFEKDGSVLTDSKMAEHLNNFFLSVNGSISPLDINTLPVFLQRMSHYRKSRSESI